MCMSCVSHPDLSFGLESEHGTISYPIILALYSQECMSARSAKERLTQHAYTGGIFSQIDQPMSKFGMHLYGIGGPLYTRKVQPTSVCITDRPYHRSAFQIRTWSEFELGRNDVPRN